jgi:CubicO group peptidase (beta-lactamase class C family)
MLQHMKRALVIVAFAAAPASAQDVTTHPRVEQAIALLDVWLDAQRDFMQIPGLSVGVVHDQALVYARGFGYADVERRTPATPATLYSICSISKLFTSIGVMQLRDAGRLRLDDPLARHLSWFDIRRSDPHAPEITIQGILTHSAGLPRESAHAYWTGPEFVFPTREQIIERLSSQETLYPAGTYFQYSNLGLSLAGEVVATVANEPYDAYVQRAILQPLGMTSTYTDMPDQHRGGRLATGYTSLLRDGARRPVTFFAAHGIAPAAGYASNVEDLARFASWQFRVLDRNDGADVLATNTLREMHRVHWVDPDFDTMWGLGFVVMRSGQDRFVGHGGSCPGFRTQLTLRPEEKVAVVVMANAQGVNTGQFAQRMYDVIAPALRAAARDTAGADRAAPDATLDRYVGLYDLGFSSETAIVRWEDGLAALSLPGMDPVQALERLRSTGEHTFRRVRSDDTLGETVRFELGADGRAQRLIWHDNVYTRVR